MRYSEQAVLISVRGGNLNYFISCRRDLITRHVHTKRPHAATFYTDY
uniref:Uncharacterized protein n=1 Tax=Arundo donax TaxID=35708 RepID=A0A0A9LXE2_ARUDO